MEQGSELGNLRVFEKKDSDANNNHLNNPIISIQCNEENKNDIPENPKESNNHILQIIQKKDILDYINNGSSFTENKKDESSINYDNININKNKNINGENMNTFKSDELNKEIKKMKNIPEKYEDEDNTIKKENKNNYTLLNTYYKDLDLNFKNDNTINSGNNFLNKNNFKEFPNYNYNKYNIFDNNIKNSLFYYPYIQFQNKIPNYHYFFPYNNYNNINNQAYQYMFPGNTFSINNQTNSYLNNNINNYSFSFNVNRNHNKKNRYNFDPQIFEINIDNILKGIDTRTTVMIRHIPNKYSYKNLLEEINIVCKDKYDFFYLPQDSENNCNLGYAFINFINPLHIVYFYNIFKSRKWLLFNSFKECDLTFGKYQGKNELTSNIEKNMKNKDKKKLPIIFEIKNPPKIDLLKKYYDLIKEHRPELLNNINWI